MSGQPRVDPGSHLADVVRALAAPDQPSASVAALDRALGAVIGHKLFTVLRHHADSGESERLYTNHPGAYPVGGRKALNPTAWARHVIEEHRPYLGSTAADVRSVFFDHELIASLGCASVLNLPVVYGGRVLGTVNLLHEERWYDESDIPIGLVFAALIAPTLIG